MESYETLSEAISVLKKQGYTEDFNLKENCLECIAGRKELLPHEFNIDKSFRFDVDETPLIKRCFMLFRRKCIT
jgi:hypothetical protein